MTTTDSDRVPQEDPLTPKDRPDGHTGPEEVSGKGHSRWTRRLAEWGVIIAGVVGLWLVIHTFVFAVFYIPSGSMIPTLNVGDKIVVDKLSYDLHPIHRSDIIVFATPPADAGDPTIKDLVKRVVGLPGDVVSDQNGHVYIDGKQLPEPYLPGGTVTSYFPPLKIPANQYFVMGDNRGDSKDSRSFGTISQTLVVGRAVLRVWPLSSITLL